jgi:hypothetical protein
MRFPYLQYTDLETKTTIGRPIIVVRAAAGSRWINYEVLVDSGADISIFDAELATRLKLNLEDGEHISISGVTGHEEDAFIHPIELTVGRYTFSTRVAFMQTHDSYGIVGQEGFFSQFLVTFNQPRSYVELRSHHTE